MPLIFFIFIFLFLALVFWLGHRDASRAARPSSGYRRPEAREGRTRPTSPSFGGDFISSGDSGFGGDSGSDGGGGGGGGD